MSSSYTHSESAGRPVVAGGAGGGDPARGSYPAEMLVDWVRIF